MTAKDRIRSLLRSRGIEVGGYRYTVGARRQQMLTHYGIQSLVDIGANIGQYALSARRAGYRGQIISFEPAAGPFGTLSAVSAADHNWHCQRFAVGNFDGTLEMQLSKGSIFNSVLNVSTTAVDASTQRRRHRNGSRARTNIGSPSG